MIPPVWSTPGSFSTNRIDSPLCLESASGFVRASTVSRRARLAIVHHVFSPSRTYSPPTLRARNAVAAVSLPAFGSVNAAAVSTSPFAIRGRYFFFCSSVPFFSMRVAAIKSRVITLPTDSHARDSSSVTTAIDR